MLSAEDFIHLVIDHSIKYVDGAVHTNGIENFWSLLKRCIRGTYVSVMPFYLFRYIDEQTFRYDYKDEDNLIHPCHVLQGVSNRRLSYKKLIGQPI